MSHQARPNLDPKMKVHGRIIRATTYCVASLLAVLIGAALSFPFTVLGAFLGHMLVKPTRVPHS